jgi:hypothetical protein
MSVSQTDVFGQPMDVPVTHVTKVRAHRRRVAGPAPATGAERKEAALTKLEAHALVLPAVEYVRGKLTELYRSRAASWSQPGPEWDPNLAPYVNADDVDTILREWADCPPAIFALPSQDWRGVIFRKGFQKTGTYRRSTRAHMNATDLPGWRPVGP